jgi:hypothetical protein
MMGDAVTTPSDNQRDMPHSVHEGYCYPRRAQTAAYLRSAAGLIMIGIPITLGDPGVTASIILGAIALAFAIYGARAWLRGKGRVHISNVGISIAGPLPSAIAWENLTDVKLSYYSTRREGTGGWMQLKIVGGAKKIIIESTLDGFSDVTHQAIAEAQARRIELSPSTRNNLRPLGIQIESPNGE